MKIIGIDPGTATTGFAILENENGDTRLLDFGCIRTSKALNQQTRLTQISNDLQEIIDKWKPEKAAVEKLFFQKNIKTAISVAEARGVILQKLNEENIETSEYTPLEIKSSLCGYGKADKKMVQHMVKLVLNLTVIPEPDDAADAMAAAICLANNSILDKQINPR